jgi:hypothetical protein
VRVGFNASDRDQRQADVAHPLQQAMQRGLVGYSTMDDRGAIALEAEAQPVKPGGPSRIEVPLEADLVPSGLVAIALYACLSAHLLLSRAGISMDSVGLAILAGVIPKLDADVVSGHHHLW